MPGFNKAGYTKEYNKANYQSYSARFNIRSEQDVLRRIAEEGSFKEYITRLIRRDINTRERRNPYIITGRKSAGGQHDRIKDFPCEVLESLPGGGYRSLGYCESMDDAAILIMNYCDQGTPSGALVIAKRQLLRHSLKHNKAGCVYAQK